jgi:hypothetical protein
MSRQSVGLAAGAIVIVGACLLAPSAEAGDFFSQLFDAFGGRRSGSPTFWPFAAPPADARRVRFGDGQAWCVRSCDGRYFPIQGPDRQSHAASCSSFCPATRTELVYGSEIANATAESGRPYSELPNAFRYRSEIVAGCSCNGKDPVGLAQLTIEHDPTLRKGDIVAGQSGLMLTTRARDKQAAANFSPLPESTRTRYWRMPVMASE